MLKVKSGWPIIFKMKPTTLLLASAVLAGFVLPVAAAEPVNLALGKSCAFSVPPTYALTRDADDARQLTDGKVAGESGSFMWIARHAVCWQRMRGPIGITVDLGKVESIVGFSMDFGAGASCVPFPTAILVYTSDDGEKWRFLGDLYARSRQEFGPPHMNGYERYVAKSLKMPTTGRYVCFMAESRTYFCTSELEVYGGPAVTPAPATISAPAKHAQSVRIVSRILRDLDRTAPGDEGLRRDVQALADDEGLLDLETVLPLNAVHARVWAKNAGRLRARGFVRPVFWASDRWENLDPLAIPAPSAVGPAALTVEMMRGETRSTAVNVLNPTDAELLCDFSVEGLPTKAFVDCREVLFTDTKLLDAVAGALKPGEGNRLRFRIPAGASKQVWISFARPTVPAGTYVGRLSARFANGAEALTGSVQLTVRDLDFPSQPRLMLGGFDYSIGDCSYYRAPRNAKANQAMMREIYANVFWAPPAVMPKGAKYGPDGALLNAEHLDFRLWDEWVARFPDARRYAVYLSVNGNRLKDGRFAFAGEPVGTARFERMVTDYFQAWRAHMKTQGMDPRKVQLLVVDEPAEWQTRHKELPGLIVAWAKTLKRAVPEFIIWEDPDYQRDPLQAGREMYEVSDALCPQVLKAASVGPESAENRAFFAPLADAGKEMWLYSCSGPSRTFDPITYYRQVFWLAYQWKAVGFCYWAFGCGGGQGDSWHAYRQPGVEYSPYFVSPTDVMAAKQSEGIKEGVQDYEYLKMLGDAVRAAKAQGRDVSSEERLLETAPAKALNQTGRDGRVKYVRADDVSWNADKDRRSVEEARLEVLHALVRLKEGGI